MILMKDALFILMLLISLNSKSQALQGMEIGFDGFFGASNLGSSFGIGPKLGLMLNENLIVGPSFRIQQTTSNYLGINTSRRVFGGGAFIHGRIVGSGKTHVYGGAEFELLKSPFNYITYQQLTSKKWAPTLFLCGGVKLDLSKSVSLTAGLYYDIINANNSPFRSAYAIKLKNEQGQIVKILPIIYRLSLIISLFESEYTAEMNEE